VLALVVVAGALVAGTLQNQPAAPPVTCAGGTAWTKVTSSSPRKALVKAARTLPFADDPLTRPADCGLTVETRCAPDLDGDGNEETLVRLSWTIAVSDGLHQSCATLLAQADPNNGWPAELVVAMTHARAAWRALGVVTFKRAGDQRCTNDDQLDGFDRRPDGQAAIVGHVCLDPDCGDGAVDCEDWRLTVAAGRLVRTATKRPSPK
jgi:hypothetical protein